MAKAEMNVNLTVRVETTSLRRSPFWKHLGPWEEWGPRIEALNLPSCAALAVAHLYGQHEDGRYMFCPICTDLDIIEGEERTVIAGIAEQAGGRPAGPGGG